MNDQMNITSFSDLTPEEAFLWHCACTWRQPSPDLVPIPLDWQRVAAMGQFNRMETLLCQVLKDINQLTTLPDEARATLQTGAVKFEQNAAVMGESLHDYLQQAADRGIETAVLKGLSVSIDIYGDPAMRPGGNSDYPIDLNNQLDVWKPGAHNRLVVGNVNRAAGRFTVPAQSGSDCKGATNSWRSR
jgi:hypothetical protein